MGKRKVKTKLTALAKAKAAQAMELDKWGSTCVILDNVLKIGRWQCCFEARYPNIVYLMIIPFQFQARLVKCIIYELAKPRHVLGEPSTKRTILRLSAQKNLEEGWVVQRRWASVNSLSAPLLTLRLSEKTNAKPEVTYAAKRAHLSLSERPSTGLPI